MKNTLRLIALVATLAFVVGFVGYAVTRPEPGIRMEKLG